MPKLLFIDSETTGTDEKRHAIIQLAGIIEIDGEMVDTFDLRMRPFKEDVIEDRALEVNGLTREQIQSYPDPFEAHSLACGILSKYVDKFNRQDKFFFLGFNGSFDLNFCHAFFRKCGDPYFGSWVFWPAIDVAGLAGQHLMAERHIMPNFKLETVAQHFGIALGNAHDALADVCATREIYRKVTHAA